MYGVPLAQPRNFAALMGGTLGAQRLLTAVSLSTECKHKVEDLAHALWVRCWSRDVGIATNEDLKLAMFDAGIRDVGLQDQLLRARDSTATKEQLKANTQAAVEHGAFGAPWQVLHLRNGTKEVVFGSDRFHVIAALLDKDISVLNHRTARL
jgi:glutathione S-transferase kappa 1